MLLQIQYILFLGVISLWYHSSCGIESVKKLNSYQDLQVPTQKLMRQPHYLNYQIVICHFGRRIKMKKRIEGHYTRYPKTKVKHLDRYEVTWLLCSYWSKHYHLKQTLNQKEMDKSLDQDWISLVIERQKAGRFADWRFKGSRKVRKRSTQGDTISHLFLSLSCSNINWTLKLSFGNKKKRKKLKDHFYLAYYISFVKRPQRKRPKNLERDG